MTKTGRAVFKVLIGGTREEIFRELVRTDRPLRVRANSRVHAAALEADARLQLRTARGDHTLGDGVIVVFDPPRRFTHTLCYTRYRDPPFTIDYDLRQVKSDVELTVTLPDLPVGTRTSRTAIREASRLVWDMKRLVETGKPGLLTRMRHVAASLMEFALPADTLTRHWPLEVPSRMRNTRG